MTLHFPRKVRELSSFASFGLEGIVEMYVLFSLFFNDSEGKRGHDTMSLYFS